MIGSIRRECLDQVVIFNERHLRHVLSSYVDYYHGPERLSHSTRIVRTRAHPATAERPSRRQTASRRVTPIATSASRPDGTNYCLPLFARRPVPHRLRILALMAFGSGPHERCLWKTPRRAWVHHGCPLLASALVPIFVGRDFSAGTTPRPSGELARPCPCVLRDPGPRHVEFEALRRLPRGTNEPECSAARQGRDVERPPLPWVQHAIRTGDSRGGGSLS